MSKGQVEVDCTKRCRSRRHGQAVTSAITKRSVSDAALASYIRGTCSNFTQAFDFEGRTALHMTVSRGRRSLMEWLVKHSTEAFVNARDRESGYTPLHRSIFYGQIHNAVALMKIGVNTDIVDKDDYKALEHATLDRQYMYKHVGQEPSDVYVWGSNSNYTLGTGTQQQRKLPDVLSCFSRTNTSVKQVCLGKFHSIWVCSSGHAEGEVWACGQLARAGAAAGTSLRPVLLRLPEPCVQAALTIDSSLFLLQSGTVIQYSLNNKENATSQSGTKSTSTIKLPSVKPLIKLAEPLGICASRVHAVVWNVRAVYSWGTNIGQLGHSQPTEKYIDAPKRVAISVNNKEEAGLHLVSASDSATLITTTRGDVYLLHRHICKKIAIKQINLKQACVEGKLTENGGFTRVTVLLLTNVGQLLIWQDTTNTLTRCVFGYNHQIVITHVTLTHDAIYFTTKFGEAFVGNVSRRTTPTSQQPIRKERERDSNKTALVKFLEKDNCSSVKISKIANVHRAVSIAVDSEGLNFACLQIKPSCGLTSLPDLSPTCMPNHMECLLESGSELDILHDVVFKVGTKQYPTHIFIIASGSELLYKLYQEKKLQAPDVIPHITLDNVHPDVFERVLKYLYTGTCDVTRTGPCPLKIRKEDLASGNKKETDSSEYDADVTTENPLEMSAFEVYKNQSEKGKRHKGRRQSVESTTRAHTYCDPVKLLQATAKRLQVMTLHKLLDKFYYKDGIVCVKENATLPRGAALAWERDSFPELVDTNVRSKDGVVIPAHKCILAARLEYFQGMFMHSWTESKMKSTVTLPVNHGILLTIINFLYTDSCPEVEGSDSIDFICSLLVVADQLFITRLREMCEVALANLITLRNCTELCQFAHTYNASQLRQCCMQFISLNLSTYLENRSLEVLDNELLEEITKYYCDFNPIMSLRIITPFDNAPHDDIVNEFGKLYPIDLNVIDEDLKRIETVETVKKKNKSNKKIEYTESEKARMRYESVSSVTSLDLSNDTGAGDITLSLSKISKEKENVEHSKWIDVPTAQQKQQKVVQARLKAISNAKDILHEAQTESFTRLSKSNSFVASSPLDNFSPNTSRMSVSPKESPLAELARSPQGNITISHVGPKLSQKQRKKLALQGDINIQTVNESFSNKLSLESPVSKSPKNPWKIAEVPVASSSSPKAKSLEFNQILADQKKQKDDSSRIMTKSLTLTQLEDKAIEELERFYNIHEVDDELISVRRIELQVSSPQWIHTAPK